MQPAEEKQVSILIFKGCRILIVVQFVGLRGFKCLSPSIGINCLLHECNPSLFLLDGSMVNHDAPVRETQYYASKSCKQPPFIMRFYSVRMIQPMYWSIKVDPGRTSTRRKIWYIDISRCKWGFGFISSALIQGQQQIKSNTLSIAVKQNNIAKDLW